MKRAFTLIEIIIVIVIIGIIATLALPKIVGSKDQAVFSEAVSGLTTMHAAQVRYFIEKGSYADDATSVHCGQLDVSLTSTNFNAPVCASSGSVSLTLKAGTYTLSVDSAGVFSCTGCSANLTRLIPH